MTEIKIDRSIDYCTQKSLADYYIRLKLSRIIDENQVLRQFLLSFQSIFMMIFIFRTSDRTIDVNDIQIYISYQLFINEAPVTPEKTTKLIRKVTKECRLAFLNIFSVFFTKMFIEEILEIPFKYQHLSYNAIIGINDLCLIFFLTVLFPT